MTPDPLDDTAAPTRSEATAPAVRAQLLATEHWSLLATRSMTWSEVMSRITIHLTVTSAALVALALVAQSTGVGTTFRVLAIGLASVVLLLGTLTGMRVIAASQDDVALVAAMNRLRAAYLDLDPGLDRYLVAAAHDDRRGVIRTYTMGVRRATAVHVAAGTAMFMNAVNAVVAGVLGALVAIASGAQPALVVAAGLLAASCYFAAMLVVGRRTFATELDDVSFPTPPGPR